MSFVAILRELFPKALVLDPQVNALKLLTSEIEMKAMRKNMKYINLTLVVTLATAASSFATVRADDSAHGQAGIPTAAAEKDARDIMHTLSSGVEMAGNAVASSSEKIREATAKNRAQLTSKSEVAKTQGQKDFEHLSQGVTNELADLRTKTENSGRQIASSFKGDNSQSPDSNLPKE